MVLKEHMRNSLNCNPSRCSFRSHRDYNTAQELYNHSGCRTAMWPWFLQYFRSNSCTSFANLVLLLQPVCSVQLRLLPPPVLYFCMFYAKLFNRGLIGLKNSNISIITKLRTHLWLDGFGPDILSMPTELLQE